MFICSTAKTIATTLFAALIVVPAPAASEVVAACLKDAADRFGHSPEVLSAILRVESRGNCLAINKNSNGSYDIGCMQINSSWLPLLKRKFDIDELDLYRPCTNIHVGAWILAKNKQQYGNTWKAVGAYNARTEIKRARYAWLIHRELSRQQ